MTARRRFIPAITPFTSTRISNLASKTLSGNLSGHLRLHAHPFYNSEQQSERYVSGSIKLSRTSRRGENLLCRAQNLRGHYRARVGLYRRADRDPASGSARSLGDIWHVGKLDPRRVQKVRERAIEVARYVLPVAAAHHGGAHAFGHRAPPAGGCRLRRTRRWTSRAVVG